MAHMIDIEEAKTIIAEQRKTSDPFLREASLHGTVARSITVHEAMTLWRIGEANRNSDPNDIMTALFNLFASAIAAELEAHIVDDDMSRAVSMLTGEFHAKVQLCLKAIHGAPSIEAREIGTA